LGALKKGVCKQTQSRIPEPKVQVDTVNRRLGDPNARVLHAATIYSMSGAQRALVQGNLGLWRMLADSFDFRAIWFSQFDYISKCSPALSPPKIT
jgi:hypothetical protein